MKPLTSEVKSRLYQLISLLEDLISVGRIVSDSIPINHFKEPMFIRVNLFRRYINRIEVIIPLLKKWEQNENIEDSIGLLIRACLVDVISQFYLEHIHSKVKECPSEEERTYLQVPRDLLADHIFSGVNYFKTLKDANVFSNDNYKSRIDDWKKLYPNFFKNEPINYDKPTKSIAANAFPSPSHILRKIRESGLFKKHNPDQLYISYFYYSKYEHFGATTYSLQNQDMRIQFYFMMDSITYILLACSICCGHFEYADDQFRKPEDNLFRGNSQKINSIREEFVRIANIDHPEDETTINNI